MPRDRHARAARVAARSREVLANDQVSAVSVLMGIAGLLILGVVIRLLMGVMMRAALDSVLGDRNFGFFAPVLAKHPPAVLTPISQYSPVVIINGLARYCSRCSR
jgi:hypothetical protein